jgi:glycine/D-amino acid oxidase-like deaminating enzyme
LAVVVGGGAIGTYVAHHLRPHNSSVTLLKRSTLGTETTAASLGRFNWYAADPLDIFRQLEA